MLLSTATRYRYNAVVVYSLIQQYFNIAFLMGKPQDLPAGNRQMQIGISLAVVTYVMALAVPFGLGRAFLTAVLDLGCTAILLLVVLVAQGHRARFEQAFGGLCGSSAFINLAAIPIYSLRNSDGAVSSPANLADFVLLVWGITLLGHIIRHTFDLRIATSVLIAFTYLILLSSLVGSFLPAPQNDMADLTSRFYNCLLPVCILSNGSQV